MNKTDRRFYAALAYCGGQPVGCTSLKRSGDGIAEVKRVFVKKEYRRHGIAKRLLKELEELDAAMEPYRGGGYEESIRRTISYYEEFYRQTRGLVKAMGIQEAFWLDIVCGTGKMAEETQAHIKPSEKLTFP